MQQKYLMAAIRIIGSQQKLAKILGTDRSNVNKWLNAGIQVPVMYALVIETLTNGRIHAEDIAPYAKPYILNFKDYLRKQHKEK